MPHNKQAPSDKGRKQHAISKKKCAVSKLKDESVVRFASDDKFNKAHQKSMRKNAKILKALADK